ncbi:MAG: hypothetical protein LAN61_08105 [Acidobacteriia bacterium]|nr:hypothetical protein [Terriglobia bacterium]
MQAGIGTQGFSATLQNDTQNKGVTWTLSGSGCTGSTCGTLSNVTSTAVTYNAPAAVPSPATVTLTATSVADNTRSSMATITVTAPVALSVAPATASVQAGIGTQGFSATLQNDTQNKGVTWTLSGSGCTGSTCGTLSNITSTAVTYNAPAAVPSPATVTLTATSVADNTRSSMATITVTAPVAVSVGPTTASVQTGQPQNFTATVTNDAQNKGVTWTLSGSGCSGTACGTLSASSSASGVAITYTAPATAPSPATLTLTATSVADTTRTASATITILAATGNIVVSVTPKRGALTITQSLAFTATVSNDGLNQGVTWNITGGSLSATSSASGVAVTFTAPSTAGIYSVTATSVSDVTKSASATVAVTDLAGVSTYHNNLSRDGTNTQEYALTTATVNTSTFGKLFSCAADGAIYAQPLWVSNLMIGGQKHNVIIVATQHGSLYAFDADASPCLTLWHVSLIDSAHGGAAGETSVPSGSTGNLVGSGFGDITPEVGITGTPVIDPNTDTLYVVCKSVIASSLTFFQRLHAINLTSGAEKLAGPVNISATYPGTNTGGTTVTFDPRNQNQRPGLVLTNGTVYVAWASHEDKSVYYGWMMGYNATTLAQVSVFNATPNVGFGGIWMGGGAPAADSSNNLYFITGNGNFDANSTTSPNNDYGDSFIKLTSSFSVADWFTPSDQNTDNSNDLDFGSGGAAILVDQTSGPVAHLVIGGGKDGFLYLLNRDNMGHFGDSNARQRFGISNSIFATAAFWNNTLYIGGVGGHLKAFPFNPSTGLFTTTASSQSSSSYGFPGTTPAVSSSGSTNGIAWALNDSQYCTPQSPGCGPAVLHAYDATNLATELWNSTQGTGNTAGFAVKFTVPTVANGKVYIGTRGNDTGSGTSSTPGELDVYGLLPN